MQTEIKKLAKSEVEITGEIEAGEFESYWKDAVKEIGANIELPGFRKGHVPENVLVQKVSEIAILEKMAEKALGQAYPKILEENKIDAIGQPQIAITKIARNNPLGFKIKTAVLPEIILSDYKSIAKKVNTKKEEPSVTDQEIGDTILQIRKMRAQSVKPPHVHDQPAPDEGGLAGENCNHDHDHEDGVKKEIKDEDLPIFDDDFAHALGDFADVADFKKKLKENIKAEKAHQLLEKTRIEMMEEIIEKSKIDVPQILVEGELDRIIYRVKSDIAQAGFQFEDYLKHINKTEEQIRKEAEGDALKRAKMQLIVNKIAIDEKIFADQDQVKHELEHLLKEYKEADKDRARAYVENILTNEEVFKFLEKQ